MTISIGGARHGLHRAASGDAHRRLVTLECANPLMALALAGLLAQAGFDLAESADDAPDLLVLDFGPAALDRLREARAGGARARIIVLIADGDGAAASDAVELGVEGLLQRSASVATVAECIAGVAAGGQWFDPQAMRAAFERVAGTAAVLPLTPRERDVARLVAAGQRNRVIADGLGISEGTVKMHLHNVYAKLGLESRTQLAMDVRLRALD